MTTTRLTIADRVREWGFRLSWRPTDRNPSMEGDGDRMDHYRCTLTAGGQRMSLTYSKGSGHNGQPPTAEEVLNCITMDVSGFENARSFAEWADEYGMDTDSRKAEKMYRTIGRQRDSLYRLCGAVGPTVFNNLLWHTETD